MKIFRIPAATLEQKFEIPSFWSGRRGKFTPDEQEISADV